MKKEYLFTDLDQYNYNLSREGELFKIYNDIQQNVEAVLGTDYDVDYIEMFASPRSYLSDTYFTKFSGRAKHLEANKDTILENDCKVSLTKLDGLFKTIQRLMLSMNKYSPKVTAKGLVSTFTKKDFEKYLSESKGDYYKAILDFYNASQRLKDFGERVEIHLIRYAPEGLIMDNYVAKIDYQKFAE